jgi:hypothetical protein
MRRFSRGIVGLGVTVLVIIGGGAYAFASSGGGTITVCVSHKTGTLYRATKCARHDAKLSWNKQGPQGVRGPQGAQGTQGIQGNTGAAGPFPATLPTGKTVVGTFDVEGIATAAGTAGAGSLATGAFSYTYLAPSQTVIYVDTGTTNPTCTGTEAAPTAPNGYTCIYEHAAGNSSSRGVNFATSSGVAIYAFATAAGYFDVYGTFAATGP